MSRSFAAALCVTTALSTLLAPAAAVAQDKADSTTLNEVVVTAQKRSERLQDVPVSVSAVDGRDLVAQNLMSLKDVADRVPGLTVNASTNRTNGIAIRGITTGGGGNPTVAVLIDDIPFGGSGYAALAPLPDLDPSDLGQIEVLRGPQGVLYGASNLGGLIKYVTKPANPNAFSGRVELGGLSVAHGGQGGQARAAANLPILEDKVGLRISGYYRDDPGFIDNSLTGKKDVNGTRTYGGRAALFLAPLEHLTVNLAALYQKLDSDELGFEDLGPDYRPATRALGPAFNGEPLTHAIGTSNSTTTQHLYSARADYEMGFATLTSLTGYGQSRFNQNQDTTARFSGLLQAFGFPANTPSVLIDHSQTNKFSQEVRLASPAGRQIEWLVGGFFTDERSELDQKINATSGGTTSNLYTVAGPNRYREIAGFANLTYKFTDQFDVQVGGRYAHNKQTVRSKADGPLNGGPSDDVGTSSESAFTWLVTPRFRFNDRTMAYVRIATGYRPGGPNTVIAGLPPNFKSDRTTTYDVGLKGSAFDGNLNYDLAAYWIDWKDIQLLLTAANGFQYFDNGGKARSRGVEGTLGYRPWTGMLLSGNFNLGEAELRDPLPSANSFGQPGDRLPFTSKFSGNLGFDQSWNLDNVRLNAGATLTYVGRRLAAFAPNATVPRMNLPDYTTVDVRAGAQFNGGWEVNLYVRNLFDSDGWTTGELRSAGDAANGFRAFVVRPRTIGVNLAKTF